MRAYEFHNKRTTGVFEIEDIYEKAVLCDLLENELQELELSNGGNLTVEFAPFEIQTIKLIKKKGI